jgi:hypothetical protein
VAAEPERGPRATTVVLFLAGLVVTVLAVSVLSALVPDIDGALASLPLVGLLLVGGTVVILGRTLRR